MKRILFTMIGTAILFSGCAGLNKEDSTRYALETAYSTTGRTLVHMRNMGLISTDDWKNVKIVSNEVNGILQEWYELDKQGKSALYMAYKVGPLLNVMSTMLEVSEDKAKDPIDVNDIVGGIIDG